ncbi:MAG: hypothetical protein JNJ57_01555 [Saprospiraceae bacterium]|nr:hypothetical protein [Saprospiraceae bacterium]
MLNQIRSAFFKNALAKLIASQTRLRNPHHFDSAKSIGIIFDATNENTRKEITEWAKGLEKAGKKTRLFAFFQAKQAPENLGFECFTSKETTWAGLPKSEKATAFAKEQFDLLLSYNPDEQPQLAWLASASKASMKIGLSTRFANDFDMQLEIPEGKGFRYFIEQLRIYLDKIVLTKP